jgi:hypothetical protein
MKPIKQFTVDGHKGCEAVRVLDNGEILILKDGVFLIDASPRVYRGIDEKHDHEAIRAIEAYQAFNNLQKKWDDEPNQ